MVNVGNAIKAAIGKRVGTLKEEWSFESKEKISTELIAGKIGSQDVLIFGTKDGTVQIVKDNGEKLWSYQASQKADSVDLLFKEVDAAFSITTTPVIRDINNDGREEVIFGSEIGKLYALDQNGKLLWEFNAKDSIKSGPFIYDINNDGKQEIIFGCNKKLYVLNNQGKLMWKFIVSSPIEAPINVLHNKGLEILFGTNDGTMYALSWKGDLLWRFKTGKKITAQVAVGNIKGDDESYIVIGSEDRKIYVLDKYGRLQWDYETEGKILSKPALADINNDGKLEIIFGSCDDKVYVLTAEGNKLWDYETDFWVVSTPLVLDIDNDGKLEIVIGSYDHSVYVLDSEGSFLLNYMPGVSAVTQQTGHYSDTMTSQPGNFVGKKIWQFKTNGMIIGSAFITKENPEVIVATDSGRLDALAIKKD